MDSSITYAVVCLVALSASAVSFLSGFGLGTVLMPAFALFFPVSVAVAMTAVVHLLNNIFMLFLVGRHADGSTVIRFGIPAVPASLLGAQVLTWQAGFEPLAQYQIHGHGFDVTSVKLVVALIMMGFCVMEMLPRMERLSLKRSFFPLGGLLTGFFGGLSGHQGALRSAFLVKSGLSKEAFIGTVVVIAVMVDIARIPVYVTSSSLAESRHEPYLLLAATLSAFTGALLGTRWIRRTTIQNMRFLVAAMLFAVALALGSGLI